MTPKQALDMLKDRIEVSYDPDNNPHYRFMAGSESIIQRCADAAAAETIVRLDKWQKASVIARCPASVKEAISEIAALKIINANETQEANRLREQLAEYKDAWEAAMKDNSDEQHCTCVPALKLRIKELDEQVERLKAEVAGKYLDAVKEVKAEYDKEVERLRMLIDAIYRECNQQDEDCVIVHEIRSLIYKEHTEKPERGDK